MLFIKTTTYAEYYGNVIRPESDIVGALEYSRIGSTWGELTVGRNDWVTSQVLQICHSFKGDFLSYNLQNIHRRGWSLKLTYLALVYIKN